MLGVACLATFGSCSKDDLSKGVKPQASVDERKSKAHGDPVKAELTLYSGHLHGIQGFHQNADIEGLKYMKRVQTMVLKYMPKGKDAHGRDVYSWTVSQENGSTDKFRVEYGTYSGKDTDHPDQPLISKYNLVYGLLIRYFDANDKDITHEFVTNGQENIHQHFFIPDKEIKPWFTNVTWNSPEVIAKEAPYNTLIAQRYNQGEMHLGNKLEVEEWKPFYYFYSDTDPWDKSYKASITDGDVNTNVKFIGFNNPTGFKGWFGFNNPLFDQQVYNHYKKAIYCDFNISIELLHAATSKTSRNENGKPSPYDSPTDAQLKSDLWDVNLSVPVLIFGSQEDGLSIHPVMIPDPRNPSKQKKITSARNLGRAPHYDELKDWSKDYVDRVAQAYGISREDAIADLYTILTAPAEKKESGAVFF